MPSFFFFFFFNDTATTEIYTLSLHDALPISSAGEGTPQRKTVRTKQQPSPSSAWLSGDLLLVTGAPGGDGLVAVARTAGSELELRAAAVNYSREDGESSQIAILWFPEGGRISPPDSIVLTADGTETIDRDALVTGELALEQFLADQLVGGDLPSRTAMLAGLFGLAHSLLERPVGHTLAL